MKKYLLYFSAMLMLALLGACGGGGSSGTIITPTPGGSVTTTLELAKTTLDPAKAETTTVTATFANNGLPIAGMPVEFSATPGYVTFNPGDGKVYTDVFGKASILMQATSAPPGDVGEVTVSAIINGTSVTKSTPFYVNKTSLRLSTPVLGQSTITAGGSVTVEVPILDHNGNIYTAQDVDVYFSSVYGGFIADNAVGKVRSNGGKAKVTYIAPYSISTQQRDTITATLGTSVAKTTVTIDPRKAENIEYVTSIPAKTELGYKQSVSLNYRVTDSRGTSIPNTPVTFKIEGAASGATLSKSSGTSDAFGYVEVVMTTGSAPTTLWVTASLSNGTSAPSAVFTVVPVQSLSITTVSPTAATTIGSNANLPVSFKVTDANGVGIVGQTVAFTVIDAKGNTSTAATVQQNSLVTDAQGNVSTTLVSNTTAANLWVKATLTSDSKVFTTTGMITVQSVDEGTVTLELSSEEPAAGDKITAIVTFTSLSPPPYEPMEVKIISDNDDVFEKISDNEEVIVVAEGETDSTGKTTIILTVSGAAGKTTYLYATIGNNLSPIVKVTVK